MSHPDNETTGDGLSRGLKIFLTAGVVMFLVVVHVSRHFTSHNFRHGH